MDSRLGALSGCKNINSADGATTGISIFAFVPDQDTVITVLTGTDFAGAAKNFLTAFGLSGKTLKAGSYYACASREKITAITLSSGAVVTYNLVEA